MVLHIAIVLQHHGSGSQNEGGWVNNTGNQIKVAQEGPDRPNLEVTS